MPLEPTPHHSIKHPSTIVALLIILLPTLAIWQGVRFSGFTPDDYMVIDIQAPIATFIDAISMFWRNDPNPQYWRPLTNSSVSVDFWLWGWDASMFHVTNLLLHLVATALVYYLVFKLFRFDQWISIAISLLFGIAACHDANMLWIAARSDVIATINMLLTLLAAYKAKVAISRRGLWLSLSYLFFFLGLCSKEVSAVVIVLLPILVWTDTPRELWQRRKQLIKQIAPYFLLAVLFLFIRLQFTVPLDEMQPVTAEGSRSPVAFIKNALYSIGYIIAPLNFETASNIINRHLTLGFIVAAVLLALVVLVFWKIGKREAARLLYKPVMLTLITGLVSFQSFERWRVYFPSVGIFAVLAILILTLWGINRGQRLVRAFASMIVGIFFLFNILQTIIKQQTWAKATAMIEGYKQDFIGILSRHPERPIVLNVLTNPIKLGDAQLIQLSTVFLPITAEAERRKEPLLAVGSLGDAKQEVSHFSNLDIYALDPNRGFDRLFITRTDSSLHVGENPEETKISGGRLGFAPNIPINDGVAKRDRIYAPGQTYNTEGAITTVLRAEGAFIKEAMIRINDTAGVPVYFDGKHIREF